MATSRNDFRASTVTFAQTLLSLCVFLHALISMVAPDSCHKSCYSVCACMPAYIRIPVPVSVDTYLSNKLWVLPVSDVILADVTMQPVAKI